jgi:ribosomal protein S1
MAQTQNLLPVVDWNPNYQDRSARSYPIDIGDRMRLVVRSIDPQSRRIKLAMLPPTASARLERGDSWPPQHISIGSVVSAVVAEKKYFGVLVTVSSQAEENSQSKEQTKWPGLITNTELSWVYRWTRYSDARDFPLQVGDSVSAKVIGFDELAHRLRLSIKQLAPDPAPAVVANLKVGQRVVGTLVTHHQDTWTINIEPWCVTTHIHDRHFDGLEPKPRMRIRAVVKAIRHDTNEVVLRNLTAY